MNRQPFSLLWFWSPRWDSELSCPSKASQYNDVVLPLHPSVSSWVKRVLDVLGAIIGIVIAAVLFLPIALAIRLDSPGPILFSQMRCGLQTKPFRLWKFRTMVQDAESLKSLVSNEAKGFIFKNESDPRITKVGRFLRRTSLDEFPQFCILV